VLVVIALVVLAVAGAGLWMVLDRPETRSAEKLCAQLGAVTSLSSSLVTLDPTTLGPQVADIRKLYGDLGIFTFDPGYGATASCESTIT
jgi:hypothetical protein